MTLKEFVKKPFVRQDATHRKSAVQLRRGYASYLDFLRNLLVIAVLFAFAEKSGHWVIYVLAFSGAVALWGRYFQSYLDEWRPNLAIFDKRWVRNVTLMLILIVTVALTLALQQAIMFTISEFARVQAQSH